MCLLTCIKEIVSMHREFVPRNGINYIVREKISNFTKYCQIALHKMVMTTNGI